MPIDVRVAPSLTSRVRLGVLVVRGVTVVDSDPRVDEAVRRTTADLRERHGGLKSAEVPGAADARALYKALGLDPTKTRPSNEALLRRVLKGEDLNRINGLVDALNLCSLRAQLPFGLYDLGRIEPPITLRLGEPRESYEGIRKGPVNLSGRPVLADERGPFGNPTSDSARTMVTTATRDALVTVYAPAFATPQRLGQVLEDTGATLTGLCGGSVEERRLLPEPG